ncbi:DUF6069 family protein [Nocardia bhagyanarayanae]|uniref:Uncharacterized protein n=1 Tax=Nocardia bhagyanarayanae TaxID=1215925 RepID=A0A543F573_9NOCA|nr:DUF6069 family protein [Nocardia bhagyanarayanae]TQM28951.1 hypothetical protein FB390_0531 [Nocardia bhagyanarayanae]
MSVAHATTASTIQIPALNRPVAVLGAVAAAVLTNLVVWLIGAAAGGSFVVVDGTTTQDVAPGGVIVMSAVPLLIGLTVAALLSYRWVGVLRVAEVVGSVLALATIAGTVAAAFDTASTVALSIMHVLLVPVIVVSMEGLRKHLIER